MARREEALLFVADKLKTILDVHVKRNEALQLSIPAGGLMILRADEASNLSHKMQRVVAFGSGYVGC